MSIYLSVTAFLLFRLFRNLYFHIAVTVPFFISQGLSLSQIFALESIYYVFKVIADVPAGAFADNFSKRLSVALSGFVASAGYILMASSDSIIGFAIAQTILGIAVALFSGADSTAILDVLQKAGKDHLYPRIESMGWVARNLGFGAAAIIGGYIAAIYGAGITWYCTAVCVFISGLLILLLPDDRQITEITERRSTWKLLGQVASFMRTDLFVAGVLIYFAAVFSLVRIGLWYMQPMAANMGLDVSMNGVLFAASIVISILFGALTSSLFPISRLSRTLIVVTTGGILFPIFWALAANSQQYYVVWAYFMLGLFLFGSLQGIYDPIAKIWVAARIPSDIRTTVLSAGSLIANLVFACIGPISGYLADTYGISNALIIMSILHAVPMSIASIFLIRFQRSVERSL